MSRIGKQPVKIEEGVTVDVMDNTVVIKGALGQLNVQLFEGINVEVKDSEVLVTRTNDDKQTVSMHGTIRSLIANNVIGVKEGYQKTLQLVGVGYRVAQQGNKVTLKLGWTHPVEVEEVEGVKFEVPDETTIIIKGIDKQLVGEVSAKIREIKKPEPYKGKGIRYSDEQVRRKSRKIVTAA
jgi:large subunit ribosomal protein L6